MPRGAAEQRGEEMAAMEGVMRARRVDPCVGNWLAASESATSDPTAHANLRHIRRSFDRATKVPTDLAAEIARATSVSQGI